MSPPSTSGTDSDDRPPTRRAVLAALATTGCLGLGSSDSPEHTPTDDATASPTTSPGGAGVTSRTTTPRDGVHLGVHNDTDTAREVRVRVVDAGERFDEVLTVTDGVVRAVGEFPPEGTYSVRVDDRTADRTASDQWTIRGALRDLQIVLGPDEIRFVQSATCDPACPPVSVEGGEAVSLPYGRTDAEETFSPAGIEVTSEYGSMQTVLSLVLRDGDTTVLDYEYRLADDRALSLPAVVETKGWYTVEASVGDETTTYEWHVDGNWPACFVHVDGQGVPRVGCGVDPRPLVLANDRTEQVQVDLRLEKRGEEVWAVPVGLAAESTLSLAPVPMGDDLTVTARVDGSTATGRYVTCYCRGGETTVQIDDAGVGVESQIAVCD